MVLCLKVSVIIIGAKLLGHALQKIMQPDCCHINYLIACIHLAPSVAHAPCKAVPISQANQDSYLQADLQLWRSRH